MALAMANGLRLHEHYLSGNSPPLSRSSGLERINRVAPKGERNSERFGWLSTQGIAVGNTSVSKAEGGRSLVPVDRPPYHWGGVRSGEPGGRTNGHRHGASSGTGSHREAAGASRLKPSPLAGSSAARRWHEKLAPGGAARRRRPDSVAAPPRRRRFRGRTARAGRWLEPVSDADEPWLQMHETSRGVMRVTKAFLPALERSGDGTSS